MKIYCLLKTHIKHNIVLLSIFISVTFCLTILNVVAPYLSGSFIDSLIANPSVNLIYKYTFLYVSLAILQIIISYFFSIISSKLQCKMNYEFNKRIIEHFQRVSMLVIERQNHAYLTQRIYSDCNTLITFCISLLNGIFSNLATFLISFVIIISIDMKISIFVFVLITIYIIMYFFTKKPIANIRYKFKEAQANYMASLQEQLTKTKLIKVYNLFSLFQKKLFNTFNELLNISIKNAKYSFLFQSSESVITFISQIVLFLFGGFQILEGNITIGGFTILSSYFSNLISSIKYFINLGNQYIENQVCALRLLEILNIEVEKNGYKCIKRISRIDLKDLSFKYNQLDIIKNLNYTFESGRIYQITGMNGSGKSTLINLIMGLYLGKYEGEILFDGIDLEELDILKFRKNNLSTILQEDMVFNGSLFENVFLNEEYDKDKLIEYNKNFSLGCFINDNETFFLNENVSNISGGEKKKICLIRGLIKKADIYIFDEPTNSLDINTKKILVSEIEKLKKDKIIILITHDHIFDKIIDKKVPLIK